MPVLNIIKIFQTIKELWSAQEFGLEICSGEITKQELSFLCASILIDLIYVPIKYYLIIYKQYGSYSLHKRLVSEVITI